ncbi:MAG: hypothetical protein WBM90_13855 [Acidimicrobiia bacterium]
MERQRRAYEVLLVAYPFEYRREYGEPMSQLFVDRLRDEGGGMRTFLVWVQMLIDLGKSAFTERSETTMKSFRTDWWRLLAPPLSLFTVFAGVGNLIEDTGGALFGRVAYAAGTVIGLCLVVGGLIVRRKNRNVGSTMIAFGVMPAFPMTIFFWFPPVAFLGVLSIVISVMAFIDAPKAPQSLVQPAQ